jgi:hypothetical protein
MPILHRYALAAGVLSGLLFWLTSSGLVLGVVVPFLPLVPLFWSGFRLGGHALTHAAMVAALLCAVVLGMQVAGGLLLFFIAPAWILGRHLLRARLGRQGGVEWYAVGNALVALVLYFALGFGLLCVYLSSGGAESDLLALLRDDVKQSAALMDPAISGRLEQVTQQYPYLIFSAVIWFAVFMIYAAACLANFIGASYGRVLRASLAVAPFDPPTYIPFWLLLSGLAGFFFVYPLVYVPQTLFFLLLIPYFLLGLALLHEKARGWENRRFWLITAYLGIVLAQWPVLALAGWGFLRHVGKLAEAAKR